MLAAGGGGAVDCGRPVIDWEAWLRIDELERSRGEAAGKPREKLVTVESMLEAAGAGG